jgi:hypothetical protein
MQKAFIWIAVLTGISLVCQFVSFAFRDESAIRFSTGMAAGIQACQIACKKSGRFGSYTEDGQKKSCRCE